MDALNTFIESGALFILFVIVVAVLCLREVRCWYWKIDYRIALMEEQNKLLKEQLSVLVDQSKIIIDIGKFLLDETTVVRDIREKMDNQNTIDSKNEPE